ncbi:MAG: 16S rRNA (cytosine(1402)-N(4))-methyltransferase RsmH [Candidatus Omnitrophica bacterium]|nr:16S rRNA (cytosine(1402)-N(4))-methyltransferase RsmH [Candidatus Omnitrophota bacterium]MDD5610021.1 16S rRNA (cytosine(1402)-N(4))-methyltransferase RsmH [Candidatus Omnitrophota bacterium]
MEIHYHIPVMCKEVVEYLNLRPGSVVIDATIGTAGHSVEILKKILPGGLLIGIDKDEETLSVTRERLKEFRDRLILVHEDFRNIDNVVRNLKLGGVDAILFDLGISSFQLDNPERGFSFTNEGPLDMRMDRQNFISAYDLVNNLNADEISNILWSFGEEHWHNRIARHMVEERRKIPIATTRQLSNIVVNSIPEKARHKKTHAATKTFQALRIAVNRELEAEEEALKKSVGLLNRGGRICVLAFHSLEDRLVKVNFKNFSNTGELKIITPKPLVASEEEKYANPLSRSAKLRVAERL